MVTTKELNIALLYNAIQDLAFSHKITSIRTEVIDGVTTTFIDADGLTELEEAELEAVVNIIEIKSLKEKRFVEIDTKTRSLIALGYFFDGYNFSLSIPAQSNLTNIHSSKELFNQLEMFPLQMTTKNNESYFLSYENVTPMYMAGLSVVSSAYTGGSTLKQEIVNAETIEAINAIIDNR